MRKLLFAAVLLLFPAMLFASVTAASASLPVNGFYYGEAGQQAMLSFKINQSELLSMTGDEWTNLPISDVVHHSSLCIYPVILPLESAIADTHYISPHYPL